MDLNKTVKFLTDLADNNDRDWFDKNRDRYKESKAEFEEFTSVLIGLIGIIDKEIASLDPKSCIFRIFRDVRFSNDKRPYKTHVGAHFVKGGKKSSNAGYYIHIEPTGTSFIAGGAHSPMGDTLKMIRKEIIYNPDSYRKVCSATEFIKYFGEIRGEELKSYPRGFDKTDPNIDLVKKKQYYVIYEFDHKEIGSEAFFADIVNVFRALKPLNDFINRAISDQT